MARDDPYNDPNRERPFAGLISVLVIVAAGFALYIVATRGWSADGLTGELRKAIESGRDLLGGRGQERARSKTIRSPFGRDYPKGSRTVAPRFDLPVRDEEFSKSRQKTWVVSRGNGRWTQEYRYWGWHDRPGPLLSVLVKYSHEPWDKPGLITSMRRDAIVRSDNEFRVTRDPQAFMLPFGPGKVMAFDLVTAQGDRSCVGIRGQHKETHIVRAVACGLPRQSVSVKALICIVSGLGHPDLPGSGQSAGEAPCPRLFAPVSVN